MRPKQKLFFKSLLLLFGSYLLFELLRVALSKIFPAYTTNDYTQSKLIETLASEPLAAFLKICLIAPIFEEFLFRTLIKPTHTELVLFLIAWPAFFALFIFPTEVHFLLKYAFLGICIACFTYVAVQLLNPYKARHLRAWISKYYVAVWILSSVAFGLVHITNYVDAFIINLPLLLHITPRIISGFFFGYIKIKNKHLGWSIMMHAINNTVPVIILLLFR